jgi:hypothetical protein
MGAAAAVGHSPADHGQGGEGGQQIGVVSPASSVASANSTEAATGGGNGTTGEVLRR